MDFTKPFHFYSCVKYTSVTTDKNQVFHNHIYRKRSNKIGFVNYITDRKKNV